MTLENNNLKKKLTDGSFEELYQNTEDFQKLNCAKNTEEVLEILNKYGYNGNSETLIREVLELLNEININDLKNVSGGKSLGKKLGHKLGGPALALLAGLTPNVRGTADTASDIQLTTTALDAKLLDQELSKAKQNKNKNSTSLVPTITQHAAEIVISSLLTVVIKNSFGKDQLSQSCPDNVINNKESSDLPVLNYFYNELKDSLQTEFGDLNDLKKAQLSAFIHFLLQTINLGLHYFEDTRSSSYDLMVKIFSNGAFTQRADMLALDAVDAYLNLNTNVNDTPPASGNPDNLLTRFRHTLPDSPITNIIENLVDSAKSEKVEVTAAKAVIIENDDEKHELDFSQPQIDSNILEQPSNTYGHEGHGESNQHDEREDHQDPPNYRMVEMGYDDAVDYLKRIRYLDSVGALQTLNGDKLWTIGGDYADRLGCNSYLTLQNHIDNYNAALRSGGIDRVDDVELVSIMLIEPENADNDNVFFDDLFD